MNEQYHCNSDSNEPIHIQQLTTKITVSDMLGAIKVRCGIGRLNYMMKPGLYQLGNANKKSPVLVTCNYKLTVDYLRKELSGIACWVLILDTKGVNVWCAAGKGSFGTDELIHRLTLVHLYKVVDHRNLIVPQLGAVGIAGFEVKKATGFQVIFGPIRANDIPQFLKNGYIADREMRIVHFNLKDRAVLTPVEIKNATKPTLIILGVLLLANIFGLTKITKKDAFAFVGSVLVGTVLVPIMLPVIPAKAFSLKGWILGLVWTICISKKNGLLKGSNQNLLKFAQYLCILPSISAVHGLNFTGSSTYTSMSGVQKETKVVIPVITTSLVIGIILMLVPKRTI